MTNSKMDIMINNELDLDWIMYLILRWPMKAMGVDPCMKIKQIRGYLIETHNRIIQKKVSIVVFFFLIIIIVVILKFNIHYW